MMNRWNTLLLAGVALAAGCGDDDSIGGKVDGVVGELNSQTELFCDCFDELGFSSKSACVNAQGTIGPSMEACIKDAFAQDEEASDTFLSCLLPLEQTYTGCMDESLDCSADDGGLSSCNSDYGVGFQNCIQLPPAVTRDLNNCGIEF